MLEKYDPELEKDAVTWIDALLGEGTMQGKEGPDEIHQVLKDGKILIRY